MTNVSVVPRRCLLPFVPIHGREVCSSETADRSAGPATEPLAPPGATTPVPDDENGAPPPELDDPPPAAAPAPEPPPAADPPPCGDEAVPVEDVPAPTETWGVVTLGTDTDGVGVVDTGVVTPGVDTDGVVTDGTVTGGGGSDGVVTVGVVTVVTAGTGTVTLGAVTVGTGGVGSESATACSASRPNPNSRTRMAAPLTPLQLRCGRSGCAPGRFGNIPREWLWLTGITMRFWVFRGTPTSRRSNARSTILRGNAIQTWSTITRPTNAFAS